MTSKKPVGDDQPWKNEKNDQVEEILRRLEIAEQRIDGLMRNGSI